MGVEVTWVAILASLCMGLGGACIFIFAVKKDYFRDFEDAKYQVFWSDLEPQIDAIDKEMSEDGSAPTARR
jgi:hypothetical protein